MGKPAPRRGHKRDDSTSGTGTAHRRSVPDPDKVVAMALRVWGYKQGEVVSLMIHLGDRLGVYRAEKGRACDRR
jgi:hypothetical protein